MKVEALLSYLLNCPPDDEVRLVVSGKVVEGDRSPRPEMFVLAGPALHAHLESGVVVLSGLEEESS